MEKTFKVNIIEDSKAAAMKVMTATLRLPRHLSYWLSTVCMPRQGQTKYVTWLAWPAWLA